MTKVVRTIFCLVVVFAFTCSISLYPANSEQIPLNRYGIHSANPYVVDRIVLNGKTIDKIIVPGPPSPPAGFRRPTVDKLPVPNPAAGINILTNVPASTWAFGCSATSAAMMFGYYDNSGLTNMYAGPTNGGVFPMTNATWGTVVINTETRALNPLSATRNGLDGRVIKGHVDDYWIKYGNTASDPFITGSWTEHTKGDCTGDYMGTNQSSVSNSDGSTTFYNYEDGSPLFDYTACEPSYRDGCHGMNLFVESRGYAVQSSGNFNQYIYGYDGNTLGFTFADFKAEIDAGHPVLIQVEGHTMLGFGYDDAGSTIYIHDTWDYLDHTMTWGGSYSGMAHYGVSVCRLDTLSSIKDDLLATWDGQGVYYRNSDTSAFVKLATPATLITAGDLDGDGIDDLIGIWPGQGGVWVKYSDTGSWAKLSTTARDIATGDMNGDGRVDLVATWDGQGVYYRNSIGGAWVKMATPATQVTAGDLDGDGKDDPIGIWPGQGGVWVKYSQTGSWAQLSSTAIDISAGDMNGDGRDDLVATWDGQGVYYRNSIGGAWVKLATPATLVAAGDLDGDGKDDPIGIWPGQSGVWVKYSQTGSWAKLSTTARHIAAGLMREGDAGAAEVLAEPFGGFAEGPGNFGYQDLSEAGPGGLRFLCREEKNLMPLEDRESALRRMPGPDEYGFQCLEQENLIPGSGTTKEPEGKEQRKQP